VEVEAGLRDHVAGLGDPVHAGAGQLEQVLHPAPGFAFARGGHVVLLGPAHAAGVAGTLGRVRAGLVVHGFRLSRILR
jgi:hypothetical protein